MAEAITYADLRFVKAPLKKSVSSRLGQDLESDEDGELTYENVQVPPGPGGPLSLASSGLGGKAGVQSEQAAAAWSSVTSPAARQILPCHAACLQYLLLGLLLTCLLLGVAAICLGVRYACCPVGWILDGRSCFYFSVTERSWDKSQHHCKSLSSDLATFDLTYMYATNSLQRVLAQGGSLESYWIGLRYSNRWEWIDGKRIYYGLSSHGQNQRCARTKRTWSNLQAENCHTSLPSICERAAFKNPDMDQSWR